MIQLKGIKKRYLMGTPSKRDNVQKNASKKEASFFPSNGGGKREGNIHEEKGKGAPLIVEALRGVDLSIEAGDFVAIMGPSGSGKSTLAQIIGLLDTPSEGQYQLHGQEVSGLNEDELALLRRDEIGFIFQQFHLLPRLNALGNVILPLLYSKNSNQTGLDRGKSLLTEVGLWSRAHHNPNELSGGQQQRVAIARALIYQPRIIIADEPTGNLDSASKEEILNILKDLNRKGITLIIVTHEDEIASQAHRLIRMRDGKIVSDVRIQPLTKASSTESENIPIQGSNSFAGDLGAKMFRNSKNFRLGRKIKDNIGFDFWEHMKQGLSTLRANKIRTSLSMLGILIGVAAVVAMLALGRGAQNAIESQLSSLGSNLLVLRTGNIRVGGVSQEAGATARLTLDDVRFLKDKLEEIQGISPTVSSRGQVTYRNKNWNTTVLGVGVEYSLLRSADPKFGRFFTEDENRKRSRVAVIGFTLVRQLFDGKNPIGEMIKINKVNFLIIGILPEKGASGWRDQDDTIVVPVQTAMHRLMGKEYVDSMDLQIQRPDLMDEVQEKIKNLMVLRKRVPPSQREDAFQIMNMADIQSAVAQSSKTMSLLLSSIAAISLLVGGIGIMNIMLVSVTERTKEIGLRKAIGARKKDVLMQFLAESIVISGVGGLAGILLGAIITWVMKSITGWTTSMTLSSVLLAFIFSALIGIIFGIYPARKASQLQPIEALRYE